VLGLLYATFTNYAVITQVVPHLESVGISRTRAAAALSILAIFGMIGKVAFGYLAEKIPARFAVMGSLGCQITGLLILIFAGDSPLVWLFVPIFGLGFGGLGSLVPLINQETFGLRAYGSIFGMVNLITLSAAFIGPPLVGYTYDTTGSYRPAFLAIAGLFVLGAIVIAFAKPPPWREAKEPSLTQATRAGA
ncbi:MAG: MFS transporter, partial [Chloroflexi bacterium]|nr:MFS transporter [Chloroflexota bacterium]